MTNREFFDAVADELGITRKRAVIIVSCLRETVMEFINADKNKEVYLPGLGIVRYVKVKAYMSTTFSNNNTEKVLMPPYDRLYFIPNISLLRKLNGRVEHGLNLELTKTFLANEAKKERKWPKNPTLTEEEKKILEELAIDKYEGRSNGQF